jgi:hypothetical protein
MRIFILFLLFGFLLISCTHKLSPDNDLLILDSLQSEELKITFINDTAVTKWYIDSMQSFWIPSQSNLNEIDSIIARAIAENKNKHFKYLNSNSIKDYYRQCICHINNDGDSIVYINALCHFMNLPVFDDKNNITTVRPDWQHYIIRVHDGGDCFWSIWINLTKRKYFNFRVNGHA